MSTRRTGRLLLALGASAMALGACGGDDGASEDAGDAPERISDAELRRAIEGTGNGRRADDVVVPLKAKRTSSGWAFANARPQVRMGQIRVELINPPSDPRRHLISFEGHGIYKNDFSGQEGSSTYIRSDLGPGRYAFYCNRHRDRGMEGTLTVLRDPVLAAKLLRR